MELEEWLGFWLPSIAASLGLDVSRDLEAAKLLDALLGGTPTSEEEAKRLVEGSTCVVFGAGPSLRRTFSHVELGGGAVAVAADGAARVFLEANRPPPHILVTDLDGGDDLVYWCGGGGSVLAVHAHGDNIEALRRVVPRLVGMGAKILPTCQVRPFSRLRNFFGFTDGDRAAWMCHALGAKRIVLVGMDFGETVGEYSKVGGHPDPKTKAVKLGWGLRLIWRLAQEAEVYTFRGSPRIEGIPEIGQL